MKGLSEAGLELPFPENIIPPEQRIQGSHIAEYANNLKVNDALYKSRFSSNLGLGLEPEKYSSHFSEVKDRIVNEIREKESDKTSAPAHTTRSKSSRTKGDSK